MTTNDTTATTNQTADSEAPTTSDPLGRFGADCPIRVGDEVTARHNPTLRGRVRAIDLNDEIAECAIETNDGKRGFAPPWALVPADTTPSEEWQNKMRAFENAQLDNAIETLRRNQHEVADDAEELATLLQTMAANLRDGTTPDPGEPATNLIQTFATGLDEVTALEDRIIALAALSTHRPTRT
ncbi:hypothetical protein IU438_18935 [Nocardia cyriacigeorgica]|uniref:hypothetical protein n=1 Tax=Nocardia cyriacigeorgica TaxID=135487 RepID=UPI001892F283|nr:hypothetical protein [Nocardia cyriacigeorgica]MBF6397869.1 hypothetical protein [Nocardia cyriacigeorgica]MBF6402474.1 hypothetical protein [Nocardia cyriacigeorgica]